MTNEQSIRRSDRRNVSEKWIQLRSDYEDDYRAMQNILDLLGRVTAQDAVDDICREIVVGVRDLLGYDRAGLFLWDESTHCFHGTYGTDIEGGTVDEHSLYWQADEWPSTRRIKAGDVFIEEKLDQPPPRPGEEHIKAYLVVLRFGAKVYGVLSVDNRITARLITQHELRYLTLFSRILGNAVDLSRIRMDLSSKNARLNGELQLAQNVQLGFLPVSFPCGDRLNIQTHYQTSSLLGGDLFDVFRLGEECVGLYIADVAGHGVSAALISAQLKMAVEAIKDQPDAQPEQTGDSNMQHPDRVLALLNRTLQRQIPEDAFITMLYMVIDLRHQCCTVSCAGHPPPVVYRRLDQCAVMQPLPLGAAVGLFPEAEYRDASFAFKPGDRVVLYTDGLIEAMDPQGEEFGAERLLQAVQQQGILPAQELVSGLMNQIHSHCENRELEDDGTLIVVEALQARETEE